jgi:hypothetical protein
LGAWLGGAVPAVQLPEALAAQERVLLLLIVAIGALFLVTALLGVITLLLRLKNVRTAAKWERLEARWEPRILQVLAGEVPPRAMWELVGRDEELYFVDLVLRYARRVRGADRAVLRELAAPYLPAVVRRARGADAERRARAVQTLGELGLPTFADVVVAAMDDRSPLVAMIAARALAKKETPQYADAVLVRLHRFTSWRPSFLASMLSSMGPEVAPALRRALANRGADPGVRAIAATALRHLHDLEAAAVAARGLETEQQRDLLASCLRLLGTVGGPAHLPLIRRLLESPDFVVRATAAAALGSLGEASDMARLRQLAVDDDSHWVAINAARALREAGDVEVLRKLAGSSHRRASVAVQVLAEVQE